MLGKLSVVERPLLIRIVKGLGGSGVSSHLLSILEVFYVANHVRSMLLECRDKLWPLFMLLLLIALAIYSKLSSLTRLRHILGLLFQKMQGLPLVL